MAILTTGYTYSDNDQVTSTRLNSAINSATFDSNAVDNVTTQLSGGAIIVKDSGIAAGKIATDAVTTNKVKDNNITLAKLEQLPADQLLGRKSAGTGNVESIDCTAAGRALLASANADAQRTALGLGTADSPIFAAVGASGVAGSFFVITDSSQAVNKRYAQMIYSGGTYRLQFLNDDASFRAMSFQVDPTSGRIEMASGADIILADSLGTAVGGNDSRLSNSRKCNNTFDDAATSRTALGLGSMATRNVTISTSNPSGGADGDVWLKYS